MRMVESFLIAPGALVKYRSGDRTTWSIESPSSLV